MVIKYGKKLFQTVTKSDDKNENLSFVALLDLSEKKVLKVELHVGKAIKRYLQMGNHTKANITSKPIIMNRARP